MNRERLDTWCEWGILGLVVAIMVFGALATGAVLPSQFLVIQALTLGVAALWLARIGFSPQPRLFWPPVCWGVVAFVIYTVARYQEADIEWVARRELIRVLVYAALFFAITSNLRRMEHAQVIMFAVVLLAVGLSLFAVYQFASHFPKIWHYVKPEIYVKRGSGTFINPNNFGGYLEMIFLLALAGALTSRLGHAARIVLGYGAGVLMAGIGVTGSRGAWVAAALALALFLAVFFFQSRFRWRAVLVLAIILALAGYFFYRFGAPPLRWQDSFANGQWSDTRKSIWQTAWNMWQDHYWFGVGPGHFDYRYPEYRAPLLLHQMDPLYVHNDYLNALVDWGLVGAVLIGATFLLLGVGVVKTWRIVRRSVSGARSNTLALLLGGGCGLCAMLIHAFTDFNLQIPANAILMASLMALLAAHHRGGGEARDLTLRWPGRALAGAVLLGALCYLGVQQWRKTNECLWLQRAEAARGRSDLTEARLALERAFAFDPQNFETAYAIGEIYRARSFAGDDDYREQADRAMDWLRRAAALNPHHALSAARVGMCLDWIGKTGEAAGYFERANQLDPNGYYTRLLQGWHRLQTGDYAEAKAWFERSLELQPAYGNYQAVRYLEIVNRELAKRRE